MHTFCFVREPTPGQVQDLKGFARGKWARPARDSRRRTAPARLWL